MASSPAYGASDPPRHDYFQTETQVIVSVYLKGCQQDDVQLDVDGNALHLTIKAPSPAAQLHIAPLYAAVDPANAGVRVLSTKVEVSLQKAQPGVPWPALQSKGSGTASGGAPSVIPLQASSGAAGSSTSSTPPSAPTTSSSAAPRPRSKWDSFKDDDETDTGNGPGPAEDASIDAFFKKLYADADEDTRRAMMKSYQESGGTALSTNWDEVKKGRVETKPPDGMEARKWS